MNPNWRSFLESADARFDGAADEVLDFGSLSDELSAAHRQTVLVPLTHLSQIDVSGEDAKAFLHSQFTSDINHLASGQLQLSAWCSAKGRMLASFLVSHNDASYRLILAADLEQTTLKRLQMFVLRAKVKLASLRDAQVLLGLSGPQAAEVLADASLPVPEAMHCAVAGDLAVQALADGRYLVSVSADKAAALWQKLTVKARPAGLPVWRWLDVQAAFPLVSAATKEEFVPQMADFEKLGGVSFHKGCYPGQEVVARTQYLGKVKRHLYRVRSEAPLVPGADLLSPENPDQAAGKILSASPSPAGGFEGLAVVQSNFASSLHLASREGPKVESVAVNP